MTREQYEINGGGFYGLMKSLNLDPQQFGDINTDWDQHDLQRLQMIKEDIETQLLLLFDILRTRLRADMDTQLVSHDGFPRSDIDVVSIRLVRIRIIRLRNDHRQVLRHLEQRMIQHFQRAAAQDNNVMIEEPYSGMEIDDVLAAESSTQTHRIPFANVLEVAENGPAYCAGLKEGDMLVLFDTIHSGNFNNLQELAAVVQRLLEKAIPVQVIGADSSRRSLTLCPCINWGGRGALGCKIVPI
ncbi:putative 26S proteasome regulatory subunit [Scheffersomyces spartinae]|uniref:Probable 26S proteasome regulatory subunit p27 n=1 Tax=Scheffersomyces spartinae TaxID=45513 RepID=A0A9P7VCI1_9ASCO|nr:putative 26S proteasome regulatory subunit [Scheffersomyces spartinae]KAG7195357.1 putative 26S proteasome regulatory subunit [Scheffersomyces spartinae]